MENIWYFYLTQGDVWNRTLINFQNELLIEKLFAYQSDVLKWRDMVQNILVCQKSNSCLISPPIVYYILY